MIWKMSSNPTIMKQLKQNKLKKRKLILVKKKALILALLLDLISMEKSTMGPLSNSMMKKKLSQLKRKNLVMKS